MDWLQTYAPYVLLAAGAAAWLAPSPIAVARSGWSRWRAGTSTLSLESDPQRVFLEAVLTALQHCERAHCAAGVDAAKTLLNFVDQVTAAPPKNLAAGSEARRA